MPATGRPDTEGWTARRVRASWSSVLLAIAAIVAVLLAQGVFIAASQPIGWVVAAASVALILSPVVEVQARWMPRVVAILATLIFGVALVASVGVALVLEIQDQLGDLQETLPAAAAELEENQGPDGVFRQIGLEGLVQDLVDQSTERIAPDPIDGAVGTVPAFVVSGVLVVFFLIWGRSMFEGLCQQISDDDRREWFAAWAARTAGLTQRYVVLALVLAAGVTVVGAAVAWFVDLPTPFVLGAVLGGASVVPYVGVLFGATPMLMLSAAFEPATTTLALAAFAIAVQAGVTVVTRTVVEARTLRVGPAVIVIAALIGSDVYGIGGALVAIVAGVLVMAAVHARAELEADAELEHDTTPPDDHRVGAPADG